LNFALLKQPLAIAFAASLVLHAFVLFGIGVSLPNPLNLAKSLQPLEVTLVNSKSKSRPTHADALAQANLNGGGNTAENRHASTPLPVLNDGEQFTPEQASRHVHQLEQEAKRMMTQIRSTHSVRQEQIHEKKQASNDNAEDLVQRSLQIARLEAQIDKDYSIYQKLPRRTHIGARTQEYRFAQYVEDWRIKIERIGNLNYPEDARRNKIFGSLVLTVSIRADGSVESVEVDRSSGQPILDAAAIRIVKLASPFAPLPPDIRKDTDILSITRTWVFTPGNQLQGQ
jgi:periplasmic protein TonB